jgi:hypothetical protein
MDYPREKLTIDSKLPGNGLSGYVFIISAAEPATLKAGLGLYYL